MEGRIELADIITAKNLCLWYGDTQALKSINIAVPEHSITALIGPSGCGKSTFLKTLNRMNDLIPGVRIAGDVRYEGKDIFQAEVNNLRKEVGMVFQKPNPFPMSIYDNIAYGPPHPRHSQQGQAGRDRGAFPPGCRHLGRGKRPAEKECSGSFRRPAAAAVHRKSLSGGAEGTSDGRADLRS